MSVIMMNIDIRTVWTAFSPVAGDGERTGRTVWTIRTTSTTGF